MTMWRRWRVAASLAAMALLAACGGDDGRDERGDQAADPTAGSEAGNDAAAYCEAARELDEQDSFPTVEQLDELVDIAPDEIRGDVDYVVGRFKEGIEAGDPGSAFADPEVERRMEPIEAFEARECGLGEGEEDEEQDPSVTALDPAATRVQVTATEYAFEFGDTAAGRTSFVMANAGQETHVMLVARLAEGATLDEVLLAEDPDELVEEEYESTVATPGEEALITAELTPGEWAMVCYLPASDGEPHFLKGMAVPFTVE